MKDGNELDPLLWQRLPQEMLERVIAKLPFARAVAFRTVCKEWYSDIIPRAAVHLDACSRSALLYFSHHGEESQLQGSAWWLQVGNAKGASVTEFPSKSFPAPRSGYDARLLACERGLLVFGFVCRATHLVRNIVVCNPLISKFKSLAMPRPLRTRYWSSWSVGLFLVGFTFDTERRSYCLVCAGKDGTGQSVTFLYDSLTSGWSDGSFVLPEEWVIAGGTIDMVATKKRSSYSNGNLYWTAMYLGENRDWLLKFDSKRGTWSFVPNVLYPCVNQIFSLSHGGTSKGEILVWHLHRKPIMSEDCPPELLSYDEMFDQHDVRPPQYKDWPCMSNATGGLLSEIKLMPHYMMEKIYQYFHKVSLEWKDLVEYDAFSHQNFIYHVTVSKLDGLRIIVHDTSLDSYTEFPKVPVDVFPASHRCSVDNVWSFSASLTSLP